MASDFSMVPIPPPAQAEEAGATPTAAGLPTAAPGVAAPPLTAATATGPPEAVQWVACDACGKWRSVPGSVDLATLTASRWECSMNSWRPAMAACSVPEEAWDDGSGGGGGTGGKGGRGKRGAKKAAAAAAAAASKGATGVPPPSMTPLASGATASATPALPAPPAAALLMVPMAPGLAAGGGGATAFPGAPSAGGAPGSSGAGAAPPPPPYTAAMAPSIPTSHPALPASYSAAAAAPPALPSAYQAHLTVATEAPPAAAAAAVAVATAPVAGKKRRRQPVEWVQCENAACGKWRTLPPHLSPSDLPERWFCHMNHWNPGLASCDAPEETAADNEVTVSVAGTPRVDVGGGGEDDGAGGAASHAAAAAYGLPRSPADGLAAPPGAYGAGFGDGGLAAAAGAASGGVVKKRRRVGADAALAAAGFGAAGAPAATGYGGAGSASGGAALSGGFTVGGGAVGPSAALLSRGALTPLTVDSALARSLVGQAAALHAAGVPGYPPPPPGTAVGPDRRTLAPPPYVYGHKDYHHMLLMHHPEVWSDTGALRAPGPGGEAARFAWASAGAPGVVTMSAPGPGQHSKVSYRDVIPTYWGSRSTRGSQHSAEKTVTAQESHLRWCRSSAYSLPPGVYSNGTPLPADGSAGPWAGEPPASWAPPPGAAPRSAGAWVAAQVALLGGGSFSSGNANSSSGLPLSSSSSGSHSSSAASAGGAEGAPTTLAELARWLGGLASSSPASSSSSSSFSSSAAVQRASVSFAPEAAAPARVALSVGSLGSSARAPLLLPAAQTPGSGLARHVVATPLDVVTESIRDVGRWSGPAGPLSEAYTAAGAMAAAVEAAATRRALFETVVAARRAAAAEAGRDPDSEEVTAEIYAEIAPLPPPEVAGNAGRLTTPGYLTRSVAAPATALAMQERCASVALLLCLAAAATGGQAPAFMNVSTLAQALTALAGGSGSSASASANAAPAAPAAAGAAAALAGRALRTGTAAGAPALGGVWATEARLRALAVAGLVVVEEPPSSTGPAAAATALPRFALAPATATALLSSSSASSAGAIAVPALAAAADALLSKTVASSPSPRSSPLAHFLPLPLAKPWRRTPAPVHAAC